MTYSGNHGILPEIQQKMKTETVTFSTKGQVVIPARIRREFHIKNGTQAVATVTKEGILLKPITRAYLNSLRGSLKGKGVLQALMQDRKRERNL